MSGISRIRETQRRARQEASERQKRRRVVWPSSREAGQTLILFVLGLAVLLGFVAMTVDVGLAFMERRSLQNAVDAAALAAAQDFVNGESEATATATAIDYVQRHGFAALGDAIEVSIPPTSGQYAGLSGYVEVTASSEAPPAFVLLFLDAPYTLSARSVAEGKPASQSIVGGGGDGDTGLPPAATVPTVPCGGPTVDGRVTTSDGYTKIGELAGGSTDYGDVFFACDTSFNYFAVRLNGPSTGGSVANENVYMCRTDSECGPDDNPGYHNEYQTGWKTSGNARHSHRDLLRSDAARFRIACDGVVLHDFIQDYLREDGSGWKSDASGDGQLIGAGPTDSASSLEWNLEHPNETGWGDDPGENPLIQSPPFNPLYPIYDSQYDGWIWEMIYEFKVPRGPYDSCVEPILFGLDNFPDEEGPTGGVHSSPAKVEGGETLLIQASVLKLVE